MVTMNRTGINAHLEVGFHPLHGEGDCTSGIDSKQRQRLLISVMSLYILCAFRIFEVKSDNCSMAMGTQFYPALN